MSLENNCQSTFSLDAFSDIEYRALNRLNKSNIDDQFFGELSVRIDRKAFCDFCLSKHLIRFSSPAEDEKLTTIKECKKFLQSESLKTSGSKTELVNRINERFSYFFGAKHFVLTEYGHTFLQAYWDRRAQDNILSSEEDLQKKLTKYEITKVEYNSFRNGITTFIPSTNDVIWGILNQRTLTYFFSKNYPALRNNYLAIALLLCEEKNHDALQYFLITICFDVNGYSLPSGKPHLVSWIAEIVYSLREEYSTVIASVAYSQCIIAKIISEHDFISMIEEITIAPCRPTYIDCSNILGHYFPELDTDYSSSKETANVLQTNTSLSSRIFEKCKFILFSFRAKLKQLLYK